MSEQINKVINEFTKQAEKFNEYQKSFSKAEYNDWAINKMNFWGDEYALEVAAGTCGFGRAISPYVAKIIELDATEAMLNVGEKEAENQNITNVSFIQGIAEELPFQNEEFDAVVTRLAYHHFEKRDKPFKEMVRVLKTKGKLVIIDMEAREEKFREVADNIERLRDPSHTKCISKNELLTLAKKNNMMVEVCETISMPVLLNDWMELTNVNESEQIKIINMMVDDINGIKNDGFEPYMKNSEIYFNHRWMICIARKNSNKFLEKQIL